MCLRWGDDEILIKNLRASASSAASVFYRFLMETDILHLLVAWGSYRAPDFYEYILINVWRRMDDMLQRASSGIRYVRKICVNQCKSVSKKRPGDTDYDVVLWRV
jgi:hypothetical protein